MRGTRMKASMTKTNALSIPNSNAIDKINNYASTIDVSSTNPDRTSIIEIDMMIDIATSIDDAAINLSNVNSINGPSINPDILPASNEMMDDKSTSVENEGVNDIIYTMMRAWSFHCALPPTN